MGAEGSDPITDCEMTVKGLVTKYMGGGRVSERENAKLWPKYDHYVAWSGTCYGSESSGHFGVTSICKHLLLFNEGD